MATPTASPHQPPPPRLHSFISAPQPPTQGSSPSPATRYGVRVLSPTKATRHLSPRKFRELQQQRRDVVLRNMVPLSPLTPHSSDPPSTPPTRSPQKEPVPWNPAWLPFPVDAIPVVSAKSVGGAGLSLGSASLDEWLQTFDHDILQFESLEKFVQVKLPEALAFCEKMEQQIAELDEREQREAEREEEPPTQSPLRRRGLGGTPPRRRRRARTTSSAMTRFPVRFRIAVFASVVERAVIAMAQSASLAHLRPWLFQARQELFRAVFADYDQYSAQRVQRNKDTMQETAESGNGDEGDGGVTSKESTDESEDEDDSEMDEQSQHSPRSRHRRRRHSPHQRRAPSTNMGPRFGPDAPRPLSFFLSRVPFVLKLQDDSQRRTTRFQRHQVVLRRIVQSLYRSLGSVFHAWKMYTRQRREERLNDKGAQLTAMVVIQRGLVRAIFVEWSKCALRTKLKRAQEREAHTKRVHDDRVSELHKEIFLLREQNARLERALEQAARGKFDQVREDEHDDGDADATV